MPIDEKSGSGILSSLLKFANKDTKELINVFLFMFVPMVFMLLLMGVFKMINKIDEPNDACWSVEKVDDQFFKINKCSGEIEILDLNKNNEKTNTRT